MIMSKFTTIMVSKETKAELDRVLSVVKNIYPFIDSYSDLINYLVWFWDRNHKSDHDNKG